MSGEIGYIVKMVVLFVLPFLMLFLFKRPINRYFRKKKSRIRIVDLTVPYFVVGIHMFSSAYSEQSWLPYFLLFIFAMGIFLTFFFVFKLHQLSYRRFFRVWWRSVFLLAFLLFVTVGIVFFVSYTG